MRKEASVALRIVLSAAVIWSLYLLKASPWARSYPLAISGFTLFFFARSLFREPLVLTFAKKGGRVLPPIAEKICRQATVEWVIFLSLHTLVTALTLFASPFVWALYNGLISYLLLAVFFTMKWFITKRRCDMSLVTFQTSGSTGIAKIIQKPFSALNADCTMLADHFHELFSIPPTIVTTVLPEHMYGMLWVSLLSQKMKLPVYTPRIMTPEDLTEAASQHNTILFVTTPSFLEELITMPHLEKFQSSCVGIISSGSLLRTELSEKVYHRFGRSPIEIFGSTETGSVAWRQQKNGPAWRLFPSVSAKAEDNRLSVDSPFCITRPFLLSDAVEFLTSETFLLKGRTDRLMKLNETFLSLPDLETALEKNPLVERAHAVPSDTPIPRVWALVKLSPAGKAQLKQSTYAAVIKAITETLPNTFPTGARPRRIRFVEKMPVNEQGKLPLTKTLPLLHSRLQEPLQEKISFDGQTYSADITFPPDFIGFSGHFENTPILPGVAQLHWANQLIRRLFGVSTQTVSRLKFSTPIRPSETIHFLLKKETENRYSFLYSNEETRYSSGVFEGAST